MKQNNFPSKYVLLFAVTEERNECFYLFNDTLNILFMVIGHQIAVTFSSVIHPFLKQEIGMNKCLMLVNKFFN